MTEISKKNQLMIKKLEEYSQLNSPSLHIKNKEKSITLSKNDFIHACIKITSIDDGVVIEAICREATYRELKSINLVKGKQKYRLMRRLLSEKNSIATYETYIPNFLLQGRVYFEAIDKKNQSERIWTYGHEQVELPPNWHVGYYHLIINYNDSVKSLEVKPPRLPKFYLKSLDIEDKKLNIEMYVYADDIPIDTKLELVLYKFRDEANMISIPLNVELASRPFRIPISFYEKQNGQTVRALRATLNVSDIFTSNGLYSIMVRLGDNPLRGIFPYNNFYHKKQKLHFIEDEEGLHAIHHLSDHASKNIRIEYFRFSSSEADQARTILSDASVIISHDAKPVWLIGEYPNTARDNGWRLFEYLREQRPDIDARYVISKDNIDQINIESEGIVELGSLAHLELARRAEAVLFTHHSLYVFPQIIADIKEKIKEWTLEFFLQHGVLAIKPVLANYRRNLHKSYDLFNVSSERERELVASLCRWDREDVVIAGMPRWDALAAAAHNFEQSGEKQNRILIFPTWRIGLDKLDIEEFKASEFFIKWFSAIENIAEKASHSDTQIDFCAHSIIQRFGDCFNIKNVNIVDVKTAVDFIPAYKYLITDYSSLCFDFLYVNKPTFFYMFDKDKFFAKEPPYIDINTNLPGIAVENLNSLMEALFTKKNLLKRIPQSQVSIHRQYFIGFEGQGDNCRRIVDAATSRINQHKNN